MGVCVDCISFGSYNGIFHCKLTDKHVRLYQSCENYRDVRESYIKKESNMTALEKIRETCPEDVAHSIVAIDCPHLRGLLPSEMCRDKDYRCTHTSCYSCWDQTIPDYWKVPDLMDLADKKPEKEEPVIKDSGDRTEFSTGAVRDMRQGKGRCDLMPLDVAAKLLGDDVVLRYIYTFQEDGDVDALYRALESFSELTYGPICEMLLDVAKHFEEGAKKYGENNWQKGIPTWCYIDSAVRHYLKFLRGDKDEPHYRAFVWNLMCCIWTCKHKPDVKEGK